MLHLFFYSVERHPHRPRPDVGGDDGTEFDDEEFPAVEVIGQVLADPLRLSGGLGVGDGSVDRPASGPLRHDPQQTLFCPASGSHPLSHGNLTIPEVEDGFELQH